MVKPTQSVLSDSMTLGARAILDSMIPAVILVAFPRIGPQPSSEDPNHPHDVEDVEGEALEALLKTALEAVCGATKTPPRPLWTLFTMQRVHNDSSGGGGEGRLATGAQLGVDLGCEASLAAARDAWRQLAGAVGAEEEEDRRELFPADEGGEAGSDDDDLALLQEGLDDDLDLEGDF